MLSSGELISRGINFLSFAYLARVLSVNDFGIMGFGTAVIGFLLNFINFGLDRISLRDIAQKSSLVNIYTQNIVSIRLLISLICFIFYSVFIVLIYGKNIPILLVFGLILFANALSLNFVFRATEKFRFLSFNQISISLLTIILYLLFVKTPNDIFSAVIIISTGSLISSILYYFYYRKLFGIISIKLNTDLVKYLIKEAFPLFLSSIMIAVYYHLDMVMLGMMKSEVDVGIYSAAYKIFMLALIPFSIIVNVFLPKIAKEISNASQSFVKYFFIMIFIGMICGSLIFIFSENIIEIVYGLQYIPSALPLKILGLNVVVISVNMSFGEPITVWGMQKKYLIAVGLGALVNVILNFLLIPHYSFMGASLATLISEVFVFSGLVFINLRNYKHE